MSEPKPDQPIDLAALAALATEANGWLERAFAPMRAALVALAPHIAELASGFQRANERLAFWDKNAPDILKRSVSRAGLIVPFSQMSFADVGELMTIYEAEGEQAVVERVRREYGVLFATEGFLAALEKSWASHKHLARRVAILREALKAHELGMFAVSVPTLIAQFEGLVADAVQHQGRMGVKALRAHVQTLSANDGAIGAMFSSFVCDAYLDEFEHGQASPMPAISRHAILHGGDISYATETNSRTMILLIDGLREISEACPIAEGPTTGGGSLRDHEA
jgi:hypothetical protein